MLISMAIVYLSNKKAYNSSLHAVGLTFVSSLHIQLVLGIILYFFLSPLTQAAFNDFGNAMRITGLRYWAIEHSFISILGIIVAQAGFSISKTKKDNRKRIKTLLIWSIVAFILIILAIPFGHLGVERPWFRV
jgi:hypothetical protein